MKTKTTFLTLISILFISLSANAQHKKNDIVKEKYNSDKNMEDEVGFCQGLKIGIQFMFLVLLVGGQWMKHCNIHTIRLKKR